MRYLFLTESEADDLKRQDFMTGADLVKVQDMMKDDLLEPSHEDSPKETLENNFCEVGVLNDPKHKKKFSPSGCDSVQYLWVQTDATSCGACAINNATQTLIAKDLCTHWLSSTEILQMLKKANLKVREWNRTQLTLAQDNGNLEYVVGIVVNLDNSTHWVALRPCTGGGWYVLNSFGESFSRLFATLEEILKNYEARIEWPMIVISERELPTMRVKMKLNEEADEDISDDD